MTSCPDDEVLLDYTAGRLDAVQTALFESHADGCAGCAELRAAQAAVWMSLDAWKPEPVSGGFNRELWRLIDADAEKISWAGRFVRSLGNWKRVAPVAAAAALVVTAFVWDHSAKPVPAPGKQSAVVVSASDADQLERSLNDIQLLHEVEAAKPEAGVL